jgi:hypothetical protein
MRNDVATCFLSGKICSTFKVIDNTPRVSFDIEVVQSVSGKQNTTLYTVIATAYAAMQLAPLGLVKGSIVFIEAAEIYQHKEKIYLRISEARQIKSFNKEDFLFEGEVPVEEFI